MASTSSSNNEVSRNITVLLSGGGGGLVMLTLTLTVQDNGQLPTATTGKTGALGGYGGRGSLLTGTLSLTSGTLNWELGSGGNYGFNRRAGNNNQGTTGNDPATGQPWGPPFLGGWYRC